jgi:hypothetical protein
MEGFLADGLALVADFVFVFADADLAMMDVLMESAAAAD